MKDRNQLMRGALWVAAALVLIVVVTLSLVPQPPQPIEIWDKFSHAIAYAVLVESVLLAAVWAPGLGAGRWPRAGALVVVGAIVMGVIIEILQGAYFVRTPDVLDALANSVGAVAGAAAWRGLRRAYGN